MPKARKGSIQHPKRCGSPKTGEFQLRPARGSLRVVKFSQPPTCAELRNSANCAIWYKSLSTSQMRTEMLCATSCGNPQTEVCVQIQMEFIPKQKFAFRSNLNQSSNKSLRTNPNGIYPQTKVCIAIQLESGSKQKFEFGFRWNWVPNKSFRADSTFLCMHCAAFGQIPSAAHASAVHYGLFRDGLMVSAGYSEDFKPENGCITPVSGLFSSNSEGISPESLSFQPAETRAVS